MADLSSAAQTVLDAINEELNEAPWDVSFLASASTAAALRAAADQLSYRVELEICTLPPVIDEQALLAIAAELDGANHTREEN